MTIATTRRDRRWRLCRAALPVATIGLLALAGCSSSGSGGGTQPSGTAGSTGTTVTIHDAEGRTGVLATPAGHTLYESDQENGSVLCTSAACTDIWLPLTVGAGVTPTGPSELTGTLGTTRRPDGTRQVVLDGKPLYTFSFDHGAGQVGGDGEMDSFDGTNFTWHAATAAGGAAPSAPSASTSAGGGYTYP